MTDGPALGPLPLDRIEEALGVRPSSAFASFPSRHRKHARQRHPAIYAECVAGLVLALTEPQAIRANPRHGPMAFEVIGPGAQPVLVAARIEDGRAIVVSVYRLRARNLRAKQRALTQPPGEQASTSLFMGKRSSACEQEPL